MWLGPFKCFLNENDPDCTLEYNLSQIQLFRLSDKEGHYDWKGWRTEMKINNVVEYRDFLMFCWRGIQIRAHFKRLDLFLSRISRNARWRSWSKTKILGGIVQINIIMYLITSILWIFDDIELESELIFSRIPFLM